MHIVGRAQLTPENSVWVAPEMAGVVAILHEVPFQNSV
jgi:hypothetical protein